MNDEIIYLNYYDEDGKMNSMNDRIFSSGGVSVAICTSPYFVGKVGIVENELKKVGDLGGYEQSGRVYSDEGVCPTLDTMGGGGREPKIAQKLTIRKLTEYECGKLMGFDRRDFEKMAEAGLSRSTLYHSAGDSIVVNCLIGIFGQLLGVDPIPAMEARADAIATQKGE